MAFDVVITGQAKVMRNFNVLATATPHDLAKAMVKMGENIIGDAKEITPVETGALRNSGHVRLPVFMMNDIRVDLGFGGVAGGRGSFSDSGSPSNTEDVGYALPVHERTDVYHRTGGAKFLEKAVMKNAPFMVASFRKSLDAAIALRWP